MKVIFIVFCVYLASLLFRQEKLPSALVGVICERLSGGDTVVTAGSISYGIVGGVRVERLRVFDRSRKDPLEPVMSADSVTVLPFEKRVKIVELRFPRLHDGYYEPGPTTGALGENRGRFAFPRMPDFQLELVRPEILGIAPLTLTADVVSDPECLDFRNIRLTWPDVDERMTVAGYCTIDLASMRVYGQAEGLCRQAHIRPLLGDYNRPVTLDVPVALPYFDGFTEVTQPVPALCAWDVNLVNNEFTIRIRLRPELGRYNGVSLRSATGGVTLHVWWKDGYMQYRTSVDVDSSSDRFGRSFAGHLAIVGTNDVRVVDLEASSGLRQQDALDIIGYLNQGTLDCFQAETPPQVAVRGVLATYDHQQHLNDLHGSMECEAAKFFGVAISNVTARFDYVGDAIRFPDARATGRTGGKIGCDATLRFPGYDDAKATYDVRVDYGGGSVEELSDVFRFDLGRRHGKADGWVHLSGSMFTNQIERLNGEGHVVVREGLIAQMKLFMGLTEQLADKVPGVGSVVNQSDLSCDFTITNGVVTTRNLLIEGSLFSISAEGSYDIVRDDMDFTVMVRFMKDDSMPGVKQFVRLLSWPFSKLLMEFRLEGSLNDPKWKYITILDRVM